MTAFRFLLTAADAVLFGILLVLSLASRQREVLPRFRNIWLAMALTSAALVVGSAQRLALLAGQLGWFAPTLARETVPEWHLAQSVVVGVLGLFAFFSIRRVMSSMTRADRLIQLMWDRVSHVDLAVLNLSPRERQVLDLMGSSLVTDAELAQALHISPSTVQTHVKSLLRKTGLHRRQDLMFAAVLLPTPVDHADSPVKVG